MKIRKAQLKRLIKEELSKVLNEANVSIERALKELLVNSQANSPEKAMRVDDLFHHDKGYVWHKMVELGVPPRRIEQQKNEKAQFYRVGNRGYLEQGMAWVVTGTATDPKVHLETFEPGSLAEKNNI